MDLDQGLGGENDPIDPQRAGSATIVPATSPPTAKSTADPATDTAPIGPDVSTPLLRRCTALATRARVDLLTATQHAASDELDQTLATLEAWDPDSLIDPDPTMVVLAAAALQDLAERLPDSSAGPFVARVEAALELLRTLMRTGRIGVMA
ncbi:hypothetical protein ACFQS2_12560 [Brachybacterium sp. GCM10030267]|uniref:hypothetical protein n=1 Tax=unclassified Brachybacterium TaxID=2623841 RepID=UPI00361EBCD3